MRIALAFLFAACGSTPAPIVHEPEPEVEVEVVADPIEEEPPAEPAPEPERSGIAELIPELQPLEAPSGPTTFGQALAACPVYEADECTIPSLVGFDARAGRWIVLDIDQDESGPASAWLGRVGPAEAQDVYESRLDARALTALGRALRPFRAQAVAANLVRELAAVEFSITAYTPLASLGPPFDGWLLHLDTVANLDAPEHVLSLVRRDLGETIELARRAAPYTPCDGGGWMCDAVAEADCTAEQLRAEDRLCVQPFGIDRVALSPDRTTMFVGGIRAVAGHGGYPPFHFVIELPARAREVMSAAP